MMPITIARDGAALEQRIGEADVLVVSGLWRDGPWRARSGCASSSRSVPAPTSFSREALNLRRFRNRLEGIGLVEVSPRV